VDGTPYADEGFLAELSDYHRSAARAHRDHSQEQLRLPVAAAPASPWAAGVLTAEADPLGLNGHQPGFPDYPDQS